MFINKNKTAKLHNTTEVYNFHFRCVVKLVCSAVVGGCASQPCHGAYANKKLSAPL